MLLTSEIYLTRRVDNGQQTEGFFTIWNGYKLRAFTVLELPWKNNQHDISCIPSGIYNWEKYESPTKGLVLLIKDVPDRTNIEMHVANYVYELRGCMAPGLSFKDINDDGLIDTTKSRIALNEILSLVPNKGKIFINYVGEDPTVKYV